MMTEEASSASSAATKTVDLKHRNDFNVKISDALNEQDIVKFTVHMEPNLERFKKKKYTVTRLHRDFVWLHDRLVENPDYAGLLIPPCPPKPDFSQSHGKLAKLQAGDASMTQTEVEKLKKEIQAEYLAAFQKTVAMHEVFLLRLVSHPKFQEDDKLEVFLTYDQDLAGRSKTTKEKALGLVKSMGKAVDSSFSNFKDTDDFFDDQRSFVVHYQTRVKDATSKAVGRYNAQLTYVQQLGRAGTELSHFGNTVSSLGDVAAKDRNAKLGDALRTSGESISKIQIVEKKLASKVDLKLNDLLRYYVADFQAAHDLLYRRIKAIQERDKTEKAALQAQAKNKKVAETKDIAAHAKERSESISESAKAELETFKARRIEAFRKNILQYAQAQIRLGRDAHDKWKELRAELSETFSTDPIA